MSVSIFVLLISKVNICCGFVFIVCKIDIFLCCFCKLVSKLLSMLSNFVIIIKMEIVISVCLVMDIIFYSLCSVMLGMIVLSGFCG